MAQILNFKSMKVNGMSKEEAFAKAPFGIMKDATQAYKLWAKKQIHGITDADEKQFMLDYLAKNTKNVPGAGCSITLESAVQSTRERPYTIEDVKRDGAKDYVKVYQLVDDATGAVVAETKPRKVQKVEVEKDEEGKVVKETPVFNEDGTPKMVWADNTKADAKELGRKLYSNGYTGNLTCVSTKQVIGGQPVAFKMTYTPSKGSHAGRWLVFGVEA